MIAAENQILSPGNFLELVTVVVVVFVLFRLTKGGAGSAVSELSKANEFLTKKVHDQGGEIRDLRVHNAQLEAQTQYAAYLAQALEPVLRYLVDHEERAEARQAGIVEVFRSLHDRIEHHDVNMSRLASSQGQVFEEMVGLLTELQSKNNKPQG